MATSEMDSHLDFEEETEATVMLIQSGENQAV